MINYASFIRNFINFFKDRNDINEKTVIGFISFCIMFLFALADLISGFAGRELIIHQYVYESFLILTLGVFGISSVDKYINKRHSGSDIIDNDLNQDISIDESSVDSTDENITNV